MRKNRSDRAPLHVLTCYGALLVASGVLLGGCQNQPKRVSDGKVSPPNEADTSATPDGPLVPDRPIEVVEQKTDDGTLVTSIEGYYNEDGQFIYHGVLTNFWETGQKKSEVHYVNGVRHGPRAAWYRDGQPWNYGEYVEGKPNGVWTEWLANGVKGRETVYVDGGLNGWLIERHADNTLKRKVMYINGLRQGRETIWDIDGTVLRETDYIDDVPQP